MSDQIKISIPLWGRGIFMSISGTYKEEFYLNIKYMLFLNIHITVAGS